MPEIPGLEQIDYLTNSSMMDVDFLPRHLLVVGGSYIGLEFGQMYRRFGSEVTVVEMGPRLMAREDEDVSEGSAAFLTREGVDLRLNAKCISVSKRDGEIVMGLDCAEGAARGQRAPTCSWRSDGGPTRTISDSTAPG